ncbi:MAG: D-aminoacyl-tRNA deacylase [Halofilum sp. (in: g-proteobacteria)]|nr:D-aminoacyl-tRNA deacylase [Halofilum sp. (in: g-proteobacteria)]
MIALLQRVTEGRVEVEGATLGAIGPGLVVLVGVERGDTDAGATRLAERLLGYRVFADAEGRMNRSVVDAGGGLLLVPQFTLAADTRKGMRPSFTRAAEPAEGERLFAVLVDTLRADGRVAVATGAFGAHMQVALVNDGPVTFELRVPPPAA